MIGRQPWPAGFSIDVDPNVADAPRFAELLAYWQSRRGNRRMPRRADIDPPIDLSGHLKNLVLIEALPESDDFRYRLIGTEVVDKHARDSTRKTVRELYEIADPVVFDWTMMVLRAVVERRAPVRAGNRLQMVRREFIASDQFLLPLSDESDVERVLAYFEAANQTAVIG